MANFKDCPKYNIYNDYYTPEYAWENISHLIPKDKIVWEACCLNSHKSKSPEYLSKICKEVVYDFNMNMLENQPDKYDMIITNPPFETNVKKDILKKLVELNKPFIIIMNSLNIYSKYMRDIFKDKFKNLQVITPNGKIHFEKLLDNGETKYQSNTSFYCIYLAYKLNLNPEDLWL
tara:strand:+ start:1551 stop:2078 length:528 start_codon:yes stop_codon:yes gene_type:complete